MPKSCYEKKLCTGKYAVNDVEQKTLPYTQQNHCPARCHNVE